jgi:hypothetical protein
MRNVLEISLALGCLAGLASPDAALAKSHHSRHHYAYGVAHGPSGRAPLVVERRSFLDPGTQVPVGTGLEYARMPAYVWGDPVSTYQRGRYMDGVLHEAFDPQPASPLVTPLTWPW